MMETCEMSESGVFSIPNSTKDSFTTNVPSDAMFYFPSSPFSSNISSPSSVTSPLYNVTGETLDSPTAKSDLLAALTIPEPFLTEKRTLPRRRSLPNLLESVGLIRESQTSKLLSQLEDQSMDSIDSLEIPIESSKEAESQPSPPRTKHLVRKSLSSDSETDSSTLSVSSNRKKKSDRKRLSHKRLRIQSAPDDMDEDISLSSATELQRFFDCMGLEDQMRAGRASNIAVSDDAMESEDDGLESVSVLGNQTLAETDDDEEVEPSSEQPSPSTSFRSNLRAETSNLRQDRISRWLVECRVGNHP